MRLRQTSTVLRNTPMKTSKATGSSSHRDPSIWSCVSAVREIVNINMHFSQTAH